MKIRQFEWFFRVNPLKIVSRIRIFEPKTLFSILFPLEKTRTDGLESFLNAPRVVFTTFPYGFSPFLDTLQRRAGWFFQKKSLEVTVAPRPEHPFEHGPLKQCPPLVPCLILRCPPLVHPTFFIPQNQHFRFVVSLNSNQYNDNQFCGLARLGTAVQKSSKSHKTGFKFNPQNKKWWKQILKSWTDF